MRSLRGFVVPLVVALVIPICTVASPRVLSGAVLDSLTGAECCQGFNSHRPCSEVITGCQLAKFKDCIAGETKTCTHTETKSCEGCGGGSYTYDDSGCP